jgi:hypothetical protein
MKLRGGGLNPPPATFFRGAIMKIENIDNSMNTYVHNRPITKKENTPVEISDKVSISAEREVNEALKVDKPPYFPIGDTQAIYRK